MRFDALIFDFDGVLLESEWAGNSQIADYLTGIGHPTSSRSRCTISWALPAPISSPRSSAGSAGRCPDDFHGARAAEDARALAEGLEEVAGAVAFIRALPPACPGRSARRARPTGSPAISPISASKARSATMIFSGREHVARGKPAPDLYLHAADALGVPIGRIAIIEDSPVGVEGALASGAEVIGLVAGRHCLPGHAERLRALGVHHIARNFDEVAASASA